MLHYLQYPGGYIIEERRTNMDEIKATPVVTEDEQKELPDDALDQASGGVRPSRAP